MRPLFLLRWSARDLRRRWLQVAAIALVIAIGTGVYSALGATATWRRESNDASFAMLAMYDVRVRAGDGIDAAEGEMLAALAELPDPSVVDAAEERLIVSTQVDASTAGRQVLVPGRLIGLDLRGQGPHITKVWVPADRGRTLTESDVGADRVVLERNFADFYHLPTSGTIGVNGRQMTYVGHGSAPEYLLVVTDEGGFFAQANFAAVFTSLETAQRLSGREGRVNDLVIRLRPGTDVARVTRQIEHAFAGSGLGVVVTDRNDEDAYRLLYDDIEGDRKFWMVFAGLILAGAALAAFNLSARMVEAQRREIGVGMALGMPRGLLAMRPMLVGAEIAVIGVVFGIAVGLIADAAIAPVFERLLPMPVWHTGFQLSVFARGAALGFALPLAATAWPVWRAMRMQPVDAISPTRHRSSNGFASALRRLRRPRSTFARMPLANILRAPRRTLLTALGIGAAITALIATLGMIDSFMATMQSNDREILRDHPDRMIVALDGFVDPTGPEVARIANSPSVGRVQPVLRFGGKLSSSSNESFEVIVDAIDFDNAVWAPTVARGSDVADGIVISQEAARDLHAELGDTVMLQHPARRGAGLTVVETPVRVTGVHPSPFRFNVYVDRSALESLELPDVSNLLYVVPSNGSSTADVQRQLFGLPSVASAQPVAATSEVVKDSIDEFVSVFRVLEAFMMALAMLIAYNATSINSEERRREHATLFAFGLSPRRVLRLEIAEAVIIGVLGTVIGLLGGLAVLNWVTHALIGNTMPEMGMELSISPRTVVVALALGVVAVATAPLFTAHRLQRMNIPGALRVVE